MTLLLALNGMDPAHWQKGFAQLEEAPALVIAPDVPNPEAVRYALAWKPAPGYLATFPNLQVIFSAGAGVDHLTLDPHLPKVPVVRVVHENLTMRMTEWIVLQVLLHHRQSQMYDQFMQERVWRPLHQWGADEVRVGVMGLGVLGQDAVKALKGLGFQVLGWSRSARQLDGIRCFAGQEGLNPFLNQTDILVSLLPLTPETRGLLDHKLFQQLAKDGPLGGPVLINAGRGGSQVEADLVQALQDGTLKAASLDVFEVEPLPASSPLWDLPNLILTPHVAAESDANQLAVYVTKLIADYEAGRGLSNVVEWARGY